MLDREVLLLNEDFRLALDVLERQGRNAFITGRAGTGKSTLLQLFRNTTRRKVAVLAPTGTAAINVRGQTIHSFFGFAPRILTPKEASRKAYPKERQQLYQRLDTLVIDEISMVRADLLDGIHRFLQVNRESLEPFGGVQVVLFGDPFQLPPVVSRDETERSYFRDYYLSPYFFDAQVLENAWPSFSLVELRRVYRQESAYFLRLLEAVRTNAAGPEELDALNECCRPYFSDAEGYITLCARNTTADRINQEALRRLPGKSRTYEATIQGQFDASLYPTEKFLSLKEGAQVMFIKNAPDREYVNGTIGVVKRLHDTYVEITVEEVNQPKRTVYAEQAKWEIVRYRIHDETGELTTEVLGVFEQLPLRLAWAVTIHKSQGKTFDRVILDLEGGAFEHGQLYVALSRCRTLEGLVLRRPIRSRDVITDPRVVDFFSHCFRQR
jgi:ATP-dependent exoDNAse (exonuclease V) alpha subunit